MSADVLVVNCGSSSLKYACIDPATEVQRIAGLIDRVGERDGPANHAAAVQEMFQRLAEAGLPAPAAIGHRVVHGGTLFHGPARIGPDTLAGIRRVVPLAPLHNPINLAGIEACQARYPDLPQVAVFDTAFHQTLPEAAWRYAVPRHWADVWGVRRYGFHGTSHAYVARRAAAWLGRAPEHCNLITLHLGNGASAAAIEGGRSVDTTMGMTPLEGLVMGTRCGDLDPAIPAYLTRVAGWSPARVETALNRDSGLKGLCGEADLRPILERAALGDPEAGLALDIYCRRIRKTLGAYLALLDRVDAVVFTGGVGEHAAPVRARVCAGLERLGLVLDPAANARTPDGIQAIHRPGTATALLVIATDEALEIARQTAACLAA